MKLNERIVRILDWPVKQTERLRDWLEEGMRAASNNKYAETVAALEESK